MPLRNLVWLLVIPAMVGLGLAIGYSAPAPDKDYRLVRQIVEVLAEVDANYVRELTDEERQKLVENMINGGLYELDRHSQYLNEQQLQKFERDNEGSFGGVGITIGSDPKTKLLKVEYPMAGTPAYDGGVVAGDLIAKVGENGTEGMTVEEARKQITGELGTKVTLTLRREGHNPPEFPVTLTRAKIALHPVTGLSRRADDPTRWNWFVDPQNKIALIRITIFNELTAKEVKAAVEEIEAAGGRGLILDLRDNPGGLLIQAIEVADLFLTEGKIVTTKDRRGGEKTSVAKGRGTLFLPAEQKPMAVLVSANSASASEIVAAALQDNNRAVVVGERTYGKGSVQSLFRLAPDQKTAVKLTTQTWWRPSGKNMDAFNAFDLAIKIIRDSTGREDAAMKLKAVFKIDDNQVAAMLDVPLYKIAQIYKIAQLETKLGSSRQNPDEWGVTPDEGLALPTTAAEKLRYEVEMEKLKYTAGRPDVVGPNPPPPPVIRGGDGKPLVDESKPFDDRPMTRALEYLRKKLPAVGAAPAVKAIPQPTPA